MEKKDYACCTPFCRDTTCPLWTVEDSCFGAKTGLLSLQSVLLNHFPIPATRKLHIHGCFWKGFVFCILGSASQAPARSPSPRTTHQHSFAWSAAVPQHQLGHISLSFLGAEQVVPGKSPPHECEKLRFIPLSRINNRTWHCMA